MCGDRAATLLALQAGDVSPEHAQVIVAVIDRLPGQPSLRDEAERMLLDQAASLNASELRKAGDHLLEVLDPDGTARADEAALDRLERSAHLGRYLTIAEDGIGGVRVRGRGTVEDAALIKTRCTPSPLPDRAPTPTVPIQGARPPATCATTVRAPWDALVETCVKTSEVDGLLPDQHGAKPRLTVTVTLDQLREGLGAVSLDTGDQLSATALRRLACDAEVIPAVLGSLGEVLDVGRTHRLVTTAIWKALVLRDEHCRFPGCRRMPLACDAHHLQHWADGGTDLARQPGPALPSPPHPAPRHPLGSPAQQARPTTRVPTTTTPRPAPTDRPLDPGAAHSRASRVVLTSGTCRAGVQVSGQARPLMRGQEDCRTRSSRLAPWVRSHHLADGARGGRSETRIREPPDGT